MSNLHFDELDEKTIKLMHDAGITPVKHAYSFNAAINRLVAVVRADEREACAKLCEEVGDKAKDNDGYTIGGYTCAKEIRARNEK
jgi:hypothetical protein